MCDDNCLGPVLDAELLENRRHVLFHGFLLNAEFPTDFLVRKTVAEMLQDDSLGR